MILTKGIQKLIASGLALLFTLSAMCVMVWALLSTEQMGLSVSVSYTSPVTAKVYLATNSSTAGQFYQDSPTVNTGTGTDFDTTKSALIVDTYSGAASQKNAFELLGAGNGLKCDANGEMEFYVYVENYSETENIYYRANIEFVGTGELTAPFTTITNPSYESAQTAVESEPSLSLLTFKIKSTNATGLNANTIRIEIDMLSFAVSSLQESSWATINLISEAGLASQVFNVGDEKNVSINGVPYTFVILGFNHDDKSDGSGKAGITFGMKNLLAGTYNMNSGQTNFGGWESSAMRLRMTNTFLIQLPSDLQSAIKTVNKLTTEGRGSSSISTSPDKLFLFSEREINGTGGAGGTTGYAGEGTQYTYWEGKVKADRIKTRSGTDSDWWLRSPYITLYSSFRCVSSSGDVSYDGADGKYGVCFGFCV